MRKTFGRTHACARTVQCFNMQRGGCIHEKSSPPALYQRIIADLLTATTPELDTNFLLLRFNNIATDTSLHNFNTVWGNSIMNS